METKTGERKPDWIRVRLPAGNEWERVDHILASHGLHTVCEEALCPNRGRCWENGRATVMILGAACSRACAFCNLAGGAGGGVDRGEPARVAGAARAMGLTDLVITSVTRDDLPDGGAALWAETVRAVREEGSAETSAAF